MMKQNNSVRTTQRASTGPRARRTYNRSDAFGPVAEAFGRVLPGPEQTLSRWVLIGALGLIGAGCEDSILPPDAGLASDAGLAPDATFPGDAGAARDASAGGGFCVSGSVTHTAGESFPSSDGCNTCSCTAGGQIVCTLRACVDPTPTSPKATCGGIAGRGCSSGEYCNFPVATACGSGDQTGTCEKPSEVCDTLYAAVCGCDGKTYSNACVAASASVSVAATGECKGASNAGTLPVGASCGGNVPAGAPTCISGTFCQHQPGALCGAADAPGQCVAIPSSCPSGGSKVCGCDGNTYGSACRASLAQMGIYDNGACK